MGFLSGLRSWNEDANEWAKQHDNRPDGQEPAEPLTGTPPLVGGSGVAGLTGLRGAVAGVGGMFAQNAAEQNDPTRFTSRPSAGDIVDFTAWRESINADSASGGGPDGGPVPTLDRIEELITLLIAGLFGITVVYVLGTLFEFQFVIGDGE